MPQATTPTDKTNTPGSWQDRKRHFEERSQVIADMQAILKTAEADKGRDLTDEENAKFDELNTRSESLAGKIERYDQLIAATAAADQQRDADDRSEQRHQSPGREDIDGRPSEQRDENGELEKRAFDSYLRRGVSGLDPQELRAITTAGQGVVGIRPFATTFFDKMKSFAGVREAGAEIVTTSHGNEFVFGDGDDTTNEGRLVGEAVTNANETNPSLGNVKLGAYKFSSDWIKVSHEMLQDSAQDVEGYITRKATERIGRAFNRYSTVGTGTGQPEGILTGGSLGVEAVAANAIEYEEILDLIHSVDAAYRNLPGFGLMMHDTTLAAIRKMKDDAGSYIWSAGAAGAPNQVLGYRYTVNNHMPQLTAGAGSKVLVAAAFGKIVVRDVTTPVIIRAVEKFAYDGLVGFKIDSRHDCRVGDASAIKWLETASAT
ncbi:MAG: phage major capsid protein [Planctomycetota bacterium]